MRVIPRSVLGFASVAAVLLGSAVRAEAATTSCSEGAGNCTVGTLSGALKADIKDRLGTEIDSGWMSSGSIKLRTRFTIDPAACTSRSRRASRPRSTGSTSPTTRRSS